jgi:hypothetical protein
MTRVIIKRVPLKYFYYFQWFILGLYFLSSGDEIKVSLKPTKISERFFLRFYSLYLGLRKYIKWFRKSEKEEYCLEGVIRSGGKSINFCYDIADCPYYFNTDLLNRTDLYFKAQCPNEIEIDGFPLTPSIRIPYDEKVFANKEKIRPSMLGPSCRSDNMYSFRRLRKGFKSIMNHGEKKDGILMCYFGNSMGPKPTFPEKPDLYNRESDILGFFIDEISHPNEKRAVATKMIVGSGEGFDGRLINDGHFGSDGKPTNAHLFIPLSEYAAHISKYKYNLNISGNRLSIPNRFIYSFAVGTAILTDKLQVKWYRSFGKEVIETTEMGYLKSDQVDWQSFMRTINKLPDIQPDEVLREFHNKWHPEKFARYVVDTCLERLKD